MQGCQLKPLSEQVRDGAVGTILVPHALAGKSLERSIVSIAVPSMLAGAFPLVQGDVNHPDPVCLLTPRVTAAYVKKYDR